MSSTILPRIIYPARLDKTNARLVGDFLVQDLSRLQDLVNNAAGKVSVALEFGTNKNGYTYIHGAIQATLSLVCQRCLEQMDYVMDVQVKLRPVMTDKAAELLPDDYDALLLGDEGEAELATLIEEEILLTLPFAPRHANCPLSKTADKG